MRIRTKEHGRIDISPDDIVHFTKPILCFEEYNDYVLLESKDRKRVYSLQSVEKPEVAFVVAEPSLFAKDWTPDLDYEQTLLELVGAESFEHCVFFAILNLTKPGKPTINLLGPIVINPDKRLAAQGISRRDDKPDAPVYFNAH